MAQAGSLLANVRKMFGDADSDFITDSVGLDWIDRAQRRFCHSVLPLDEFKDYNVTAKENKFDLPTDAILPIWLMWFQSRTIKLEYVPPDAWAKLWEGNPNATGTPDAYTVLRRQVVVGPQVPQTASKTASASGAMSSTTATLNLTAASGTFRSKGWVVVDSEVIEYTGVATTTLTGGLRGVHGTDAATHASGATVSEIDLQMFYRKTPALSATGTTLAVPAAYQDYLEKYVLYLAWLAQGQSEKAQIAFTEFEQLEKDAKKTVGRRAQDGLLKIRDKWRSRWW